MKKAVFLDYNSTTPVSSIVLDGLQELFRSPLNASSTHLYGRKARKTIEEAREDIAKSLGFNLRDDGYNILFTSSGTEANNMVIKSFAEDNIIFSAVEHLSIIAPALSSKTSFKINVERDGSISRDHLNKILSELSGTKIVSVMLANNETGIIHNIKEIAQIVHEHNGMLHCDIVQAYGKIAIDIKDLNCDMLTISAHKCGGLQGCGALIFKDDIKLKPLIVGGGQERGFRSGTENALAIASLGIVARKINEKIKKYQQIAKLKEFMEQEIEKIADNVVIIGKNVARLPNTALLSMPGFASSLQLIKFDLEGIALSVGSACSSGKVSSSYVLEAMGIDNEVAECVTRVSLGEETTLDEVNYFIKSWGKIYNSKKNRDLR
jgi:cysteine desulfurase